MGLIPAYPYRLAAKTDWRRFPDWTKVGQCPCFSRRAAGRDRRQAIAPQRGA
ncbi:hypothetical protein ACFOSW_18570 [Paenibacillus sp. GCM10012303]